MKEETQKYNPAPAMIFAAIVYAGVVLAATTLFISFVLTAFPTNAYLSRIVMVVGGLLIGASSIAFPVALHTWTIEKKHRAWTTFFYYGEVGIMAINTVVAFMSLLGQHTDYIVPEWALLYEPFSVAAIVYTLFAWGTTFLLDPAHKRTQQSRQLKDDYESEVAKKRMEFLHSIEGEQTIAAAAAADIQTMLLEQRNGKKHFGTPEVAVNPDVGFVKKETNTPAVKIDERPS
jgi:glucan phosphoethanolaminetransferase (alkaline phosphatase superfamily)